jgi:hypothetical protein
VRADPLEVELVERVGEERQRRDDALAGRGLCGDLDLAEEEVLLRDEGRRLAVGVDEEGRARLAEGDGGRVAELDAAVNLPEGLEVFDRGDGGEVVGGIAAEGLVRRAVLGMSVTSRAMRDTV